VSGFVTLGIKEFDEELGEIQPGSLVIVHGGPGSGKTTFALSFLKGGVESDEKTVFVSFVEGRNDIVRYSKAFNIDVEKLEADGRIKIIEVPTLVKGLETVFNEIVSTVLNMGAKRLILDSFSAVRDVLGGDQDVRAFVHNILLKLLKNQGITTLITLERLGRIYEPTVEEYVADIVIDIDQKFEEIYMRELTIKKFRGKVLKRKRYCFTIHNGFKVIKPVPKPIREPVLHKVLEDGGDSCFSTGISDLDRIIGGGFEAGSVNLIMYSEEIPIAPLTLITPIIYQFVLNNRGVRIVSPPGYTAQQVKDTISEALSMEKIDKYCRILDYSGGETEHTKQIPHVELSKYFSKNAKTLHQVMLELGEKTCKPILAVDFIDVFEELYGVKSTLQYLPGFIAYIRETGNIALLLTVASSRLHKDLISLSDVYLHFFERNGAVFIRGVKPATEVYAFQFYVENHVRKVSLIPMV